MTGGDVAIDTSWAIGWMESDVRFARSLSPYSRLLLPAVVLGEILYGAVNSARTRENFSSVEALLMDCEVLPVDEIVARHYAETRLVLRRQGTPIPENDLWIASICLAHGVPLATRDQHFQNVPKLDLVRLES